MKQLTFEQANNLIQDICYLNTISIHKFHEDSYWRCTETDNDPATWTMHTSIEYDGTKTKERLSFTCRIRMMPDSMTPDELRDYATKYLRVASCVEDLNEAFRNVEIINSRD